MRLQCKHKIVTQSYVLIVIIINVLINQSMDAINDSNYIYYNQSKSSLNGNINNCYHKKSNSLTVLKMSTEDQFNAAVNVIKRLPKNGPFQPSDDLKLRFYALFKQATEGPNRTKKPAFYNIVALYKWDVWTKLGDMDKQTAMNQYIDELKKVIETMSFNESVSEFYEVLGPFHEFVPHDNNQATNGSNNNDIGLVNNGSNKNIECMTNVQHLNGNDFAIDSDGEEFSDTYDHIGENGDIPIVERNGSDISIKDMISFRGGNDSNPSAHISPSNSSDNRNISTNRNRNTREVVSGQNTNASNTRGEGGSGGHGHNLHEYSVGINEQLALAVIRLQQSMDQVVNRLDALEAMLSRNSRTTQSREVNTKSTLWPFKELRPQTAAVLLVWPLIVQLVLQYIRHRRRPNNL
ncbi:acyl-CoA-binding domain-containing protein 5-like isoform X2 [Oppia nitens]|uniref:acyl-CoA-binding domain-containing protein 5-like isoform X2 n=1 Tax=Oppia nitens TaxID=1686743 RepID=UPI0023D9975C|nr:acyl-CoA-binding domain-containing protein 5-like isoform X2 [Oppia nitens]